jgi:glutamate--cysteine ligase
MGHCGLRVPLTVPADRPCLTIDALRAYVRERCFAPTDGGLVGVEWESLTFAADNPRHRPPTNHLSATTAAISLPRGGAISLEPGGQVELSSLPQRGLAAALSATTADHAALTAGLRRAGIQPVARGLDALRPLQRVVDHPRYAAMEAFFDADGPAGRTMMCATASIQVNLDVGPPGEMTSRWRLAHQVGPLLVALFAHSPCPGRVEPRSARQQVWAGVDRSRTAPVHVPGRPWDSDPAEEWLRYALAARVMLVRVDGDHFEPVTVPLAFAAWMAGGHEFGYPTLDDFAYHLTTLFPPVRPRGWLELRMIDSVPDPWWRVAVAVAATILDDPEVAAVARAATRGTAGLWAEAARLGLADPRLGSAARQVYQVVVPALVRLGVDAVTAAAAESFYERFVARGRSPADAPLAVLPAGRAWAVPARV